MYVQIRRQEVPVDRPNSPSPENSLPRADLGNEPAGPGAPPSLAPPRQGPKHATEERPAKPSASQPVERPLTIGQVQRVFERRLGFTVAANTLERWCRQGKIYAVRLGPEWRIPRETVEEIIKIALAGERF